MSDAINEGRKELTAMLAALKSRHGEPTVFMAGMLANSLYAIANVIGTDLPANIQREHVRKVVDEVFNEYCSTVEVDRELVYKVADGIKDQLVRIAVDASQESPSKEN